MRETAEMTDENNEIELDEDFREWVRQNLERMGTGAKGKLARHLGKGNDYTTRLIRADEDESDHRKRLKTIPIHIVPRIEEFFGAKSPARTPTRTVPIVGYVGASADGSVLFAEGDGNFGDIEAPIGAGEHMEALEVRGDSMRGVVNDGWILFYEDKETPQHRHMRELCVCWLEDGRVLVKEPSRGSEPGLFNLYSANAPLMSDVAVRYFAIVTDMKTRRGAKRYMEKQEREIDELRNSSISASNAAKLDLLSAFADMSEHERRQVREAIANWDDRSNNPSVKINDGEEAPKGDGEGRERQQGRGRKAG